MPLIPEIPGFYYDNEKKKYFKIAAVHTSTSSVYNVNKVKQEKETADKAQAKLRKDEATRPLLKRRRRISDSSNGLSNYRLRAQMGLTKLDAPRRDGDSAMWATVLQEDQILRASRDSKLSGLEVVRELGGCFTFAPKQCIRWHPEPYDHFYEQKREVSDTIKLPDMENRMTSSVVQPSGKGILVASGNSFAMVSITKHGRPSVDSVTKIPEAGTIWTCVMNQLGTTAIAGSSKSGQKGLLSLSSSTSPKLLLRPESDVLALEYIDNNVLLTGSRNGKINIYDSRRNLEKDLTHETALASHISSITHLRKLKNENYILVNGLGNQAVLHDLRFCRPISSYQRGMPKNIARPVLTYETANKLTIGLGFDVDASQEIMAIAGEDHNIRLFSISSGRLLKTIKLHEEISAIKFSEDKKDGCRDLFAAAGPWVYRYHTGHAEDEDVDMEDY